MIYHFIKDKENNALYQRVYDWRCKEFYDMRTLDLSNLRSEVRKAFPANNRVAQVMRARLLAWRGFGNENELYMALNEDELNEIWWEDDMSLMNGAVIRSRCSMRDRMAIAQETKQQYRSYTKDWH